MNDRAQLSVNLNKIALLRNSRGHNRPNLLQYAQLALKAGAAGLTVHPRPDGRHILPRDVHDLSALLEQWNREHPTEAPRELNVEGYPSPEFLKLMADVRPHQVTLVPDPPEALTSDHGWNPTDPHYRQLLQQVVPQLLALGGRVSLFVDPEPAFMAPLAATGAQRVELYTGPYAEVFAGGIDRPEFEACLAAYQQAAHAATEAGLALNAGHDLNLDNLTYFLRHVPGIREVSIGHALTEDALHWGYEQTVRMYVAACEPVGHVPSKPVTGEVGAQLVAALEHAMNVRDSGWLEKYNDENVLASGSIYAILTLGNIVSASKSYPNMLGWNVHHREVPSTLSDGSTGSTLTMLSTNSIIDIYYTCRKVPFELADKPGQADFESSRMALALQKDHPAFYKALHYIRYEMLTNVYEHSDADAYVEMMRIEQKPDSDKRTFEYSLIDTGRGIRDGYLRSGLEDVSTDVIALQSVLSATSRKPLDEGRGHGLSSSRMLVVKGMNGRFILASEKALLVHSPSNRALIEGPLFADLRVLGIGTLVHFSIDLPVPPAFNLYNFL